jgi:hypothetical protein
MRRIVLAGLAVIALAMPASGMASPRPTETPGTAEARMQVEIARSITDPDAYLFYVKSLADNAHARECGDKR